MTLYVDTDLLQEVLIDQRCFADMNHITKKVFAGNPLKNVFRNILFVKTELM